MKPLHLLFLLLIAFCQVAKSQSEVDKIVLINVNHLDRAGIAKEIAIVNSFNPSVIAINQRFTTSNNDEKDATLANALWECKRVVMAGYVTNLMGEIFFSCGELMFIGHSSCGFINTLPEKDPRKTLRRFTVSELDPVNYGTTRYHFAIRTAMKYDSLKAMSFVKARPKIVEIDYGAGKRKFKKYSPNDLFDGKVGKNDIEGKIVIFSFLGPGDEDKYFTPLSRSRKRPDMYAGEYMANIVAQVLESK